MVCRRRCRGRLIHKRRCPRPGRPVCWSRRPRRRPPAHEHGRRTGGCRLSLLRARRDGTGRGFPWRSWLCTRAFPARCGLVSLACTRAFRPVAVRLPMFQARCSSVNEANLPGGDRLAFYHSRIPSEAGLHAGVVAHREFGPSDSRRAIRWRVATRRVERAVQPCSHVAVRPCSHEAVHDPLDTKGECACMTLALPRSCSSARCSCS